MLLVMPCTISYFNPYPARRYCPENVCLLRLLHIFNLKSDLKTTFVTEANTMNHYKSDLGSYSLHYMPKSTQQMREQTTTVVNGGNRDDTYNIM